MHDSFNGNNSRKTTYTKLPSYTPPMQNHSQTVANSFKDAAAAAKKNTGNTGSAGKSYSNGKSYSSGSSGSSTASQPSYSEPAQDNSYNAYAEYLRQQQAMIEAAAAAKRQAAQDAYNRGMNALNNAYGNQKNLLRQNYDSGINTLTESYNNGVSGTNRQADKTMNEAYINYMLGKRDMGQMMSAQGLTGGAAESTLANMQNQYGNSRNTIDVERNNNLATLLEKYNANKASALEGYNNSLASLENNKMAYQMELENALANQITSAANTRYDALANLGNQYLSKISEYAGNMQDAAAAAAAVTYAADNAPASVNTAQGAAGGNTNYSLINRLFGQGYTTDDVISSLSRMGYTSAQIQQMLMGA